jgi:Uncharacterized protein conserved in bacteria (DUF2242)
MRIASCAVLLAMLGCSGALSGCAGPVPTQKSIDLQVHRQEMFDSQTPFARRFPADAATLCERTRRALMSQGYVIWTRDALSMHARKYFRPEPGFTTEMAITASCAQDEAERSSGFIYVSAWQDHYVVKRDPTSASLGVSVLGSISMPVGASEDALVKVGVETIRDAAFYERFYALLESMLRK